MSARGPLAGSLCRGRGPAQRMSPGPRGGPKYSTARRQLTPEATLPTCAGHLRHLLPHPHAATLCHRPEKGLIGRRQASPEVPRESEGRQDPPRLEAQGAALQEGHLLLQECRGEEVPAPLTPSSLPPGPLPPGWASAGGQGSNDGGRKLGRCRLPQAPVCELTPGGTQPPQRRRGRRGPLTPPHSAGHGHVSSSWSTPSRRQLRDQSGGLPGGASRGKTHRHSAHKGPLADGAVGCPALEPGQAGRGPDLRPNQGASARFQLGLLGESTVLGVTPQLCGDCSRRDHPLPGVHGATVTL